MKDSKLERLLIFSIPADIYIASFIILDELGKRFSYGWWILLIIIILNVIPNMLCWIMEKLEK